jgi:hypothetical protein
MKLSKLVSGIVILNILLSVSCSSHNDVTDQGNTVSTTVPVPPAPEQIVSNDFDSDGHSDIAVISKTQTLTVFLNKNGNFDTFTQYETHSANVSLCTADFNSDGFQDLAPLTEVSVGPFLLGDGAGNFSIADKRFYIKGLGRYIIADDLNNDGFPDLVVAASGYITVLINKGNLDFDTFYYLVDPLFYSKQLSIADLDGNGFKDIIAPDYFNGTVYVMWNEGGNRFTDPTPVYKSASSIISSAIPINFQGQTVLAVSIESAGEIIFLQPKSRTEFNKLLTISVPALPSYLMVSDMNNNSHDDLIVVNLPQSDKGSAASIIFGPDFMERIDIPINGYSFFSTVADWNGDGFPDLFIPNYYLSTITYSPSPGKGIIASELFLVKSR